MVGQGPTAMTTMPAGWSGLRVGVWRAPGRVATTQGRHRVVPIGLCPLWRMARRFRFLNPLGALP